MPMTNAERMTTMTMPARARVTNVVRMRASILMSTSGPTSRNATMEPGVNVDANDSAKNASTFEQIDTIIASAIIPTMDRAG